MKLNVTGFQICYLIYAWKYCFVSKFKTSFSAGFLETQRRARTHIYTCATRACEYGACVDISYKTITKFIIIQREHNLAV